MPNLLAWKFSRSAQREADAAEGWIYGATVKSGLHRALQLPGQLFSYHVGAGDDLPTILQHLKIISQLFAAGVNFRFPATKNRRSLGVRAHF